MNIHTYLNNKDAQQTCSLSVNENGICFVSYHNKVFTLPEFDLLFPVNPLKIIWEQQENKGDNYDRTKLWMDNKKSY